MTEKSFLLFKPGVVDDGKVYSYVINCLTKKKIMVEHEYSVTLTPTQMYHLWPRLCDDLLLYYTIKLLYRDPVRVIEVCGENAIEEVSKIKRDVRVFYALGLVRNCIHAPANLTEYKQHICALKEDVLNHEFVFDDLHYKCYKLLTEEMRIHLAECVANVSLYTMIHSTIPYENNDNSYRYYLVEDETHSFTDYVCFIYDVFPCFDFETAVALATILETYGEVCLIDTNKKRSATDLLKYGKTKNMIIKFHRIKTKKSSNNKVRKF